MIFHSFRKANCRESTPRPMVKLVGNIHGDEALTREVTLLS